MLQATCHAVDIIESHLFCVLGQALAALGGLLKGFGAVLEPSWGRLGAAAAFEACFDAAAAASKRSCIDLQRLRSALGSIPSRLVLLSFLAFLVFSRRKTR